MKTVTKCLLFLVGLCVIAAVAGLLSDKQLLATASTTSTVASVNNPVPVTVTNTPLPVQGSVGISGTPSVNIANTPTVALTTGTTVQVSGAIRNLDDPGRVPYQSTVSATCSGAQCGFGLPFVPLGHRVVIQHIGGILDFDAPATKVDAFVDDNQGRFVTAFPVPVSSSVSAAFDRPVLFYIDQSQRVTVIVFVLGANFISAEANAVTLSGYEVDCNAAPCSAIATQ